MSATKNVNIFSLAFLHALIVYKLKERLGWAGLAVILYLLQILNIYDFYCD